MTSEEHAERMRLRGALGYLAGYSNMTTVKKYIREDADTLYRFLADIAAIADGALAGKNALDIVRERTAADAAADAAAYAADAAAHAAYAAHAAAYAAAHAAAYQRMADKLVQLLENAA